MHKHSIVKAAWARTAGLLVAGTLLLVSSASAAIGSGTVTANTPVGPADPDPLRGIDIPAVAADPADPRHIVMANANLITGNCEVRVTFDGGATWDVSALKTPDGFLSPPCRMLNSGGYPHMNQSLAFGTGQNVYTVFDSPKGPHQTFANASRDQGQADSVLVARSTDGGRTFSTAVVAIAAPVGPAPYYIRPTLGVQPRPDGDRVYVAAWGVVVASGGPADGVGDRRMVTAASKDGGATWSAPVDASAPGEQIREPSAPVVGPDGSVYVAWKNRDTGAAPSNVIIGKSTDGGATWTRTPAGVTTGLGQGAGGGMPQLAVDRTSGALNLVYQEVQPHGDQDIFFQRSTDAGATWSSPLRVNDDPTGNKVRQHVPRIAVAPDGRIDVVWLDHRHAYPTPVAPVPRGEADVYYASSTNGGAVFSANRRITDRAIGQDMGLIGRIGSYSWYGPVLAPLGNDGVFFAWSDPRNGNVDTDTNDIFTATLRLDAGASPSIHELPKASPADLSVAASQMTYPGGTERINPLLTSKLVVVNKNDVAAAWAGAVLARHSAAPLLVVDGESLSKDAKTEIGRLHPTGVYVIGDRSSIPDTLVTAITAAGVIPAASTSVPTTAAPTTTAPAAAPSTTASTTTTLPTRNPFAASNVIRLEGATAADIGRAVAGALDARSDADRSRGAPAVAAAVVVNPDSQEGASALGMAAALRFPVLFVTKDDVPAATADAISALHIQKTYVVGGSTSVSDAVMAELPEATRLGGADAGATGMAVAKEAAARNVPVNVVYVADQARPVDAAVAATMAARNGGLLVLSAGAETPAVEKQLDGLGLASMVDRIVVVRSSTPTSVPWALTIGSILLAVLGIALLDRAARKRRAQPPTVAASTTTGEPGSRP